MQTKFDIGETVVRKDGREIIIEGIGYQSPTGGFYYEDELSKLPKFNVGDAVVVRMTTMFGVVAKVTPNGYILALPFSDAITGPFTDSELVSISDANLAARRSLPEYHKGY